MNNVPIDKIRNFAIAGHAGAGKTSLSDLILFKSGKVSRLGKVQEKNSVSDYHPDEHERQNSIYATPLNCQWNDHTFFFIDTPGYADFFGDTKAALSIVDSTLVVINGVEGIEIGTSRAWKTSREKNQPRMIFINALDKEYADFEKILESIQKNYGKTVCIPFTLPVGRESNFKDVVHVLRSDNIPDELRESVEKYKSSLMDTAAESDEELMMRYLDGEELSEEEISHGLRDAIFNGSLVPVFSGSVEKDIGIKELMNGIVNLLCNPFTAQSIPMDEGEMKLKESGAGKAFVFKTVADPFIGQLSFFRVYSGILNADSDVYNVTKSSKERLGHFHLLNGKEQTTIKNAYPGYIIAVAKLKHTKVNDTISTTSGGPQFLPIKFPKPNMSYACYPTKRGDEDKIISGLNRLADEDPTVKVERHPETREFLISGIGDQHLKIIINRLKSDFKTDIDLRTPKVPYRETITKTGIGKYRHKKQSGGHGQFGEVWLRVEPLPDEYFEFASEVVGGNIPKNYIPSVEKGIKEAMKKGDLSNSRIINVKVIVYDGKYHAVDSSDIAFQIAGRGAFRDAIKQANPKILEPYMHLKILIPDQYMGDITGDLNQRRGRIQGMNIEEGMQLVEAEVPMAEVHSYASQLRSITQGKGRFNMAFSHYEQVPENISKQIEKTADKETHDDH